MTQIVNVPGVGQLNFPDGMSQADMASAIRRNYPQVGRPAAQPVQKRGSALKNLGIAAARPVAETAVNTVGFLSDALGEGVNLAARALGHKQPLVATNAQSRDMALINRYLPIPNTKLARASDLASQFVIGAMTPGGAPATMEDIAAANAARAARSITYAAKYAERLGVKWETVPNQIKNTLTRIADNPKDLERLDPNKVLTVIKKGVVDTVSQEALDTLAAQAPKATARSQLAAGASVQGTLRKAMEVVRNNIDKLYAKARSSGETEKDVDIAPLVKWLQVPENSRYLAWFKSSIRNYAKEQKPAGAASAVRLDTDISKAVAARGKPAEAEAELPSKIVVSVNDLERMRQEANAHFFDGTGVGRHYAAEAKKAIDSILDTAGGKFYQAARAAHAQYVNEWVKQGIIKRLTTDARGTHDPRVALEDTFQAAVVKGSLSDLLKVRTMLARTQQGEQAWNDLQAAGVHYLKSVVDKGANRFLGRLQDLDADGKLDLLYGTEAAHRVRSMAQTLYETKNLPRVDVQKGMGAIAKVLYSATHLLRYGGYALGHFPGYMGGVAAEHIAQAIAGSAPKIPLEEAAARATARGVRTEGIPLTRRLLPGATNITTGTTDR